MNENKKTYVFAAHPSHFRAFHNYLKQAQPNKARFVFSIDTIDELRKVLPKYEVIFVGPYWKHPRFDVAMEAILNQSSHSPATAVLWFPFSLRGQTLVSPIVPV